MTLRKELSLFLSVSRFNEPVHLIPRFYDPISGYVYCLQRDGLNVSNIKIYGPNI
jgi:hypothetical protein